MSSQAGPAERPADLAVPRELLQQLLAVAIFVDQLFCDGTLSDEDGGPVARLHELALSALDGANFFEGAARDR